jgi:phosphate transport system permease protein
MKSQTQEKIAFALLSLAAFIVALPVIFIPLYVFIRGMHGFNWEFISQMPRNGMLEGGIFPAIMGTLYLVIGVVIVAVPLGVVAAVYLTEYAKQGLWTRIVRLAILNLAGVPSVVYGLFGLGLFVLFLKFGTSLIAGVLTLAVLVLPIIITNAEEALRVVPISYREASYALGSTRWQTLCKVTLPQAMGGILTGTILAISRAAGETAPILFTCAAFYLPALPKSLKDQIMALPYHLYVVATQLPDAPARIQWGTALALLLIVLTLNVLAAILRARLRKAYRW